MINDFFKFGMHHAHTYYKFLVKLCLEDVEQEVRIAILELKTKERRELNNAVNRKLYHLARVHGFRKPWKNNIETNWYKIEKQYPIGGRFI